MNLLDNKEYIASIDRILQKKLPYEKLKNKSILITGATGMIGSYFVDVLMRMNQLKGYNLSIYALGRSMEKAKTRFSSYWNYPHFSFVSYNLNEELGEKQFSSASYILHLASNTHPLAYSGDPIGTILPNVIGTNHLLDFASKMKSERVLFASSVEIYGENRKDVSSFDESYLGYIDCNTLRAGYPESKRCGEALCQAYIHQKGLDIVMPRLSRVYGPTMLQSDSKALSQFLKKGINGEDIILKSEGNQLYSYTYVADVASALLFLLLKGECGQAYNVADEKSDISLKDLAGIIAGYASRKVVFELPDEKEKAGYSTATKALLDSTKLKSLGWSADYSIQDGIVETMNILKKK